MHRSAITIAATVVLSLALLARADEVTDKGRELFQKYQQTVVTIQVVQKITASSGGKTAEPRETKQDITGTVMDASGLTVLALSAADPTEMYRRMYEASRYKVESEITDIKILLHDGTEVPSEIVLRDVDLDLAFIRPKTKPAQPMTAVDFANSSLAQVLDPLISLNRLGRAAGRAYSASIERVSAVVQKPRTFYIPDSTMTATSLGSPAFATNGKIVGVIVMRTIAASAGGVNNFRSDSATSIILPAEDILKAAKQAPEAKGGETKPEEPKETPKTAQPELEMK